MRRDELVLMDLSTPSAVSLSSVIGLIGNKFRSLNPA